MIAMLLLLLLLTRANDDVAVRSRLVNLRVDVTQLTDAGALFDSDAR
jgi:hypothetical protein